MSTSNFVEFSTKLADHFSTMSEDQLYTVDVESDMLWDTYLGAFPTTPKETNPIFKKNTEHNCSCCRSFVKDIGKVVAIQNGTMVSVWDLTGLPEPYQSVCNKMASFVHSLSIDEVYYSKFSKHGNKTTHSLDENKKSIAWNHFQVDLPNFMVKANPQEIKGQYKTDVGVFKRGLTEITVEALDTVLELIEQNQLYRGSEMKNSVSRFKNLLQQYKTIKTTSEKKLFCWKNTRATGALIRNTAIGTLLIDLSEDRDVDAALASYHNIVAPGNYQRPKADITPLMITKAMDDIDKLGYIESINRRHAKMSDISITQVLYVDGSAASKLKDAKILLKQTLLKETKPFPSKGGIDISIQEFEKLLKKASSVSLIPDASSMSHFMSLTTAEDSDAPALFKWDNNFAWSYDGDFADSIKERVKKAGGQVEGNALRVSLAWFNTDDLDLHCNGPSGNVYYGWKKGDENFQILDVDMNVALPVRNAVENMRWPTGRLRNGTYIFYVHNYNKRESKDVGFEIEVEQNGEILKYSCNRSPRHQSRIEVLTVSVYGKDIEVKSLLGKSTSSIEKWGVKIGKPVKVNAIINSPNQWTESSGQKHWFFILEDCLNPDPVRGLYNEFLHEKLYKHRKVFEVIGSKTKASYSKDQLSGLGFTLARGDTVKVSLTMEDTTRLYNVTF